MQKTYSFPYLKRFIAQLPFLWRQAIRNKTGHLSPRKPNGAKAISPDRRGRRSTPQRPGFRTVGDPMAENISIAHFSFLPEPGKGNGTAVIVAPGMAGSVGVLWGTEAGEVAEATGKAGNLLPFVTEYSFTDA